jgi:prepilin-type N-terminal cleavage/methylation domain-containing protein
VNLQPCPPCKTTKRRLAGAAFSLLENLVAMAVIGVVVGAFYSAFTQGFMFTSMTREDRRATQILLQKSETIRLCSWSQINSNGYIPTNFTVTYDPQLTNSGVTYTGTVTIANAPLATPYSNDLKQVTLRLNWTTGKIPRQREIKTFVARYGLQTYVDR